MTRQGNLGAGIGITTSNAVFIGATTAGGVGSVLSGTAWMSLSGTAAIFNGYVESATRIFTGYDSGVTNSISCSAWFRTSGDTGIYFASYGRGLYAADIVGAYGTVSTYGGGKNGWAGYVVDFTYRNAFMFTVDGNGGHYQENGYGWVYFFSRTNAGMGIGTSTTSASYRLYVDGGIYATADVVAYSDIRKKTNIETIENAKDKVLKLRGVYYDRIGEVDKGRQLGVIAQEVNEILPEAVSYASDIDEYGVKYGNIVGLLIEAIKEQQSEIEELKNRL